LRPWFPQVERRDFANDLAVTEVEPVIAYLESTAVEDETTAEHLAIARDIVSGVIAREGVFPIHTAAGVFIARKDS
jgi:hypothetical protein